MSKKEKKVPSDFLEETFGEKKELVVNDDNQRERIVKELQKRGVEYAQGDYPIVKDGNVVGFEKRIILNKSLNANV